MTYYVEWRRTVRRVGPLKFVALDQLEGRAGFRGCYGFPKAAAEHLQSLGRTAKLRGVPVYADTLFVDYDSDDGPEEFEETLRGLGLAFEIWHTGRRGVHFHIPHEPIFGSDTPQRHKAWVTDHAQGDWDPTIYRPAAVIRLPGTWHEKNPGHRKQLVTRQDGARLKLPSPLRVPAELATERPTGTATGTSATFWGMVHSVRKEPGRRFRAYAIAATGAEAGMDEQVVWDALVWWAQNMTEPRLDVDAELERIFRNGYNSLAKGLTAK